MKKEDLKIGQHYYILTCSGVEEVIALSVEGDSALIQIMNSKREPYHIDIQYLFANYDFAKLSMRIWEKGRRTSKKR